MLLLSWTFSSSLLHWMFYSVSIKLNTCRQKNRSNLSTFGLLSWTYCSSGLVIADLFQHLSFVLDTFIICICHSKQIYAFILWVFMHTFCIINTEYDTALETLKSKYGGPTSPYRCRWHWTLSLGQSQNYCEHRSQTERRPSGCLNDEAAFSKTLLMNGRSEMSL